MAGKRPEDKVGQIEKVVMYSRIGYSVNKEADEQRFLSQETVMREFCEEHNLTIKDSVREVAPGTLDLWSRPALHKALDSLKWPKKEKSVLLGSRADRLSKEIGIIAKLQDDYNPNFLVASTGFRFDQFITQIQVACAEEEFRLKYGEVYRTSPEGLKEFSRRCRFFIELGLKSGLSLEQIALNEKKMGAPRPYGWKWMAESVQQLINMWD